MLFFFRRFATTANVVIVAAHIPKDSMASVISVVVEAVVVHGASGLLDL